MYSAVNEHFCETAWVESFILDLKIHISLSNTKCEIYCSIKSNVGLRTDFLMCHNPKQVELRSSLKAFIIDCHYCFNSHAVYDCLFRTLGPAFMASCLYHPLEAMLMPGIVVNYVVFFSF